ncbi:MAG: LysR family transcriptional regulator, partial [Asticcacaulis sp.]
MLAVWRHKSALKAAEGIHMSQPAVTGAVSALETLIGQPLFTRTPRGMEPTQAGQLFCARAQAAVAHLEAAEVFLNARRGGHRLPMHRLVSEGQLRALSAIIETGGFSQAARRLGLAQPSVHRAARELETLCGLTLFRRTPGGIEPTAEAREVARRGDLFGRELQAGVDELAELKGVVDGTLSIGALPLARSEWLPRT